jgi:hypothetical protein
MSPSLIDVLSASRHRSISCERIATTHVQTAVSGSRHEQQNGAERAREEEAMEERG